MIKKIIKTTSFLSILTTLSILSIFNPQDIFAQSSTINLSVSPPITYMSIKPGEKKDFLVILENKGDTTLEVNPDVVDFDADNMTGQPILKETSTFPYISFASNLSIEKKKLNGEYTVVVEPHQTINLPITIDMPKGKQEEEHTMTLLFDFKKQTDDPSEDSQAKVAGTVGSNLILLVTNNNSDRGDLIVKKIKSLPTIDSFMPIRFTALAENLGKNATAASGSATISNWQNKEVAKFDIHPDMILSGKSRELREKDFVSSEFRYKKPFLIGIYQIKIELKKSSIPEAETFILKKTIIALPFSFVLLPLSGLLLYSGYRLVIKKTSV